jgi:hypothetical protein
MTAGGKPGKPNNRFFHPSHLPWKSATTADSHISNSFDNELSYIEVKPKNLTSNH